MLTSKLYVNHKIHGPYMCKDGRRRVVLAFQDEKVCLSYAKFLVQEHLGRFLDEDEEVHHDDEDKANDSIGNLLVLPKSVHRSLPKGSKYPEQEVQVCCFCDKPVVLSRDQLRHQRSNRTKGKVSPFCSRRCSGLYGKQFQ